MARIPLRLPSLRVIYVLFIGCYETKTIVQSDSNDRFWFRSSRTEQSVDVGVEGPQLEPLGGRIDQTKNPTHRGTNGMFVLLQLNAEWSILLRSCHRGNLGKVSH